MQDDLIKRLIASIKCGSCGCNYEKENVEIIEHDEQLWFLKVLCSSCHVRCLVAAIVRGGKKPEVITDLTAAEMVRFKDSETIEADDVLDMHNFLKDFNGDFPQVF